MRQRFFPPKKNQKITLKIFFEFSRAIFVFSGGYFVLLRGDFNIIHLKLLNLASKNVARFLNLAKDICSI